MKRSCALAVLAALAGCASPRQVVHSAARGAGPVMVESPGLTPGSATVATAPGASDGWFHAAPLQTRVLAGSDGSEYVGVWLDTPAAGVASPRAPLDVALVIDTSGSMAGDKIANARMAATSFIESLADGDIVALYAFSDATRELAPPTSVNAETRGRLIARVGGLSAEGGTNMFDALRAGEGVASQAPATHPVHRVVVISDGRANVGPSTPEQLGAIAAAGTEYGTQVTAIGVGLDYDEHTLGALAVRSAGRVYHLAEPSQMSAILHDELQLLGQTVAANAYLEFTPAPGVEVQGTDTLRVDHVGATLRIPLGSLYASQHREVLLRAHLPTGSAGDRAVGTARLVYEDPGPAHAPRAREVALRVEVTGDTAAPARGLDEHVQAMVSSYEAAQAQLRAVQLLNENQAARAAVELERAEQQLRVAAQYHFSDEAVQGNLLRQAAGISRGRAAASAAAAAPRPMQQHAARGAALMNNADAYQAMGF